MSQLLAIDLFCGLGGWTEGLLAEGYDVVGFDIEQHVYGEQRYPAQLVLQDILTIHGKQFKDAALIVASPPCQEYSYMAMPWSLAKAKQARILADPEEQKRLTALFDACFRIQREAIEVAGHFIPLVVENVKGAQKWVGKSSWNYGSFHLWGDVPALMPMIVHGRARLKTHHGEQWNVNRKNFTGTLVWNTEGKKNNGGSWFNIGSPGQTETGRNPVHELAGIKNKDVDGYEREHPEAFGWKKPRTSSHSKARKAASAMIAKIPFELSRHIARSWKP